MKAAFGPRFEARPHQVALLRLAHQTLGEAGRSGKAKIVVAEWPCAAGKSISLAVYALFLHSQDSKEKILICVPNKLLARLMQLDCRDGVASDTKGLGKAESAGIYVCTHSDLLELSEETLSGLVLAVDELHELLRLDKGAVPRKLHEAKQVFALSATLGGRVGKERLEKDIGECTILDTAEQLGKAGSVKLDIHEVSKRRSFGAGNVYRKALDLAREKAESGVPVLLYLKDMDECRRLEKRHQSSFTHFVFDAEDEEALEPNLGVLEKIKNKADGAPDVILTSRAASFGINFFPNCYPIMTEVPESASEYKQIIGRSNRLNFAGGKKAALLTSEKHTTQASLEEALELRELNADQDEGPGRSNRRRKKE